MAQERIQLYFGTDQNPGLDTETIFQFFSIFGDVAFLDTRQEYSNSCG